MRSIRFVALLSVISLVYGCGGDDGGTPPPSVVTPSPTPTPTATPPNPAPIVGLTQTAIAQVPLPWDIAVLDDGRILASSRTIPGTMTLVSPDGAQVSVSGLPDSVGMLDIELAPDFRTSRTVFFSYMYRDTEAPRIGRAANNPAIQPEGVAIGRGVLNGNQLTAVQTIYRSAPIVSPNRIGQPGARMTFSPDGRYLFMTLGDRQEEDFNYLFSLDNDTGKIIRIFPDGTIPTDNPWFNVPGAEQQLWSRGHRNPYGLVFSADGFLWSSEHGPTGGDEFNVIASGVNYGWPVVTNGTLSGSNIGRHTEGDGFIAPVITWTPAVAPAGMVRYTGNEYFDWNNDFLLTGLQQRGIVRVRTQGIQAQEVQRIDLGARIRSIALAPDGGLFVVTDGETGEIRRLAPVR